MTIDKKLYWSFLVIFPIFLIIAFFNRYIFNDDYLIFLPLLLVLYLATKPFFKVEKRLVINSNTFYFLTLIFYFIFRFNQVDIVDLSTGTDILNVGLYFLVFTLSGIISYNIKSIPTVLWLGVSVYILMVIVRSLIVLAESQIGFSLASAIVILMIIPYALASPERYRSNLYKILFFSLIIFFGLSGARGAILALLGMYLFINYYYFFSRTKAFYAFTFLILLLSISTFLYLYINLATSDSGALFSSDSVFKALQKRVGTRLDIWIHAIYFIATEPLFGHGTNMSTTMQAPSPDLDFSMLRTNISAHSTYFEVLYRSGFVGLAIYLVFWYKLWMSFYKYQHIYEIRIASGMIVSILILSMTSTVMIFNVLELWSSFAWCYLGFSYGKIVQMRRLDQLSKLKILPNKESKLLIK